MRGLPAELWVSENSGVLAMALARFGCHCPPMSEIPWDTHLADHLTRAGVTVAEERVAAELLDELAGQHTLPRKNSS